jgi:anti-sigma-K factor RskA
MYDPGQRQAVVVLERLPPLEAGKIYQLWWLRGAQAAPLSAGTVNTEDEGVGSVVVEAPTPIDAFAGLGITLEPRPGGVAPTGPLVAAGLF